MNKEAVLHIIDEIRRQWIKEVLQRFEGCDPEIFKTYEILNELEDRIKLL